MKRWERWSLNLSCLAVSATGVAYFWMKYFIENDDPFAVVNHPWQAWILGTHLLTAPLFILMFGIVLNSHVMKKLGAPKIPNRKTGLVSLGTFAAMVLSGYVLQVVSADGWLRAVIIVHVASSVVFSATYGVHLWTSLKLARRARLIAIRDVA